MTFASNRLLQVVASNRLTSILDGVTTTRSFTYDGAGNILTDTRSGTPYTYTYNARNRLATVTSGALIWGYTYNGLEQLVVRELTNAGPDLTHFVHDRFGNVIAESDGTGHPGSGSSSRPASTTTGTATTIHPSADTHSQIHSDS